MFDGTASVLNRESVSSNISYKSFKTYITLIRIIIQLTPHWDFSVTDYIKYYAHVTYLAYTAKLTPSPPLNRIEQCFAAHIVHSCQVKCQQY
jgi:hypothetical protein